MLAIADNETPIICNGFKDDEYIEMVMLAKKIGRQIIPVVEKYTELDLIVKHSQRVGVRPVIGLRLKLASTRIGTLEVVRRLSLQVRPDRERSAAGAGSDEGRRHGGLPRAAALPPRQPDHQHPPDQGRGDGSRAHLRRAEARRRRPEISGRRRRPGHRLRRLADRFRVQRQLHAAGIRQRRRLSHPERVRRSRSGAPDHRFRKRPRHRRLSQRAGVQRPGRQRIRRRCL